MIKWIKESDEKPPYSVNVLMWNDCVKCRNEEDHAHVCVYAAWNCPNSFQKGSFCKGMKDDPYAHKYGKEMQNDYWSPFKPSHWAYVNSPFDDMLGDV